MHLNLLITMDAWTDKVDIIGERAIDSYKYFYKNDSGINQKSLQRDYIYYGITPQNQQGSLNRSVSEYISFIEVNPRVYFQISDQWGTGLRSDDPYITTSYTEQKKVGLSEDDLLNRMWSRGFYDFEFHVTKSNSEKPNIVYVPLSPEQIWDFNIEHRRQHGSFWRRSKNFYRIDPWRFTSKKVWLKDLKFEPSIGSWDLSEESLYRYVDIYEVDDAGNMETIETTHETTRVKNEKFKKKVKVGVGLDKDIKADGDVSVSVSVDNSNAVKEVRTILVKRKETSDYLGSVKMYFYDPIIERRSGREYEVKTYSTGKINFGITAK